MRFVLAGLLLTGFSAFAETKTCAVSGMHCKGCQEMVEGKVCDETKYSTCTIKIIDAKKKIGEVHLVTKDSSAKVDENALSAVIKDSGYELKECKTKKGA
jgi:hypothetical protein